MRLSSSFYPHAHVLRNTDTYPLTKENMHLSLPPIFFHGLIFHFLLVLNNISLFRCIKAYFSIH